MHAIDIRQLVFRYAGKAPLFDGFSWQVEPGDAWSIIGPSGSGKSTLLYIIAGLRRPSSGSVSVEGKPVPRPRARTGLILQDYGLLPWATVRDNVALVMRMGRFYRRKRVARDEIRPYPREDLTEEMVDRWLTRLGIAELRDQYPGQLSGGQRQRTAIARTLMQQPTLLLMDEPFSSLDAVTREDLQALVASLRREAQLTTVVVTHSIEEAVFLGQRVLVLGRPPIVRAEVIENAEAGSLSFRESDTFLERCAVLRAALMAS